MGTVVNTLHLRTFGEKKISWISFFYRCILPSWTWSPCRPCFTGFVLLGMFENVFSSLVSIILAPKYYHVYHSSFYCIISSPNRVFFDFCVMASSKTCPRESKNHFIALSLKKIVGSNIWGVLWWWKGVRPGICRDLVPRVLDSWDEAGWGRKGLLLILERYFIIFGV